MSDASASAAVTMYWRPGCGFCIGLQRGLEDLGIPWTGINIWEDTEAAAFVRQANRGNELVPTVVVGGATLRNPSAGQVQAAIAAGGT